MPSLEAVISTVFNGWISLKTNLLIDTTFLDHRGLSCDEKRKPHGSVRLNHISLCLRKGGSQRFKHMLSLEAVSSTVFNGWISVKIDLLVDATSLDRL